MVAPDSGAYVSLLFDEPQDLRALDFSSLVYDIELAHDLSVMSYEGTFPESGDDRFFWYRNSRRLKPEHKLRLGKLSHRSPIFIEVIAGCIGGALGLIQIFKMIDTWKLEKEKLELEVSKLRREEAEWRRTRSAQLSNELRDVNFNDSAKVTQEKIIKRLKGSPIKLTQLNATYKNYEGHRQQVVARDI